MIVSRRRFHAMLTLAAAGWMLSPGGGERARAAETGAAGVRGVWSKKPCFNYPQGIGGKTKHTRWARRAASGNWYVNGGDYAQPGEHPSVNQSGSNNTWRVDFRVNTWERVHGYWPKEGDFLPSHPDETVWTYDSKRDVFWHGAGIQWPPYAPAKSRETSGIPVELQDRLLHGHWMSFDPKVNRWTDHGPIPKAHIHGKYGHYDPGKDWVLKPYLDGNLGNAVSRYDCASREWLPRQRLGGPNDPHIGKSYSAFDSRRRRILFLRHLDFLAYYYDIDKERAFELRVGAAAPARHYNTYALTYHASLDVYVLHGGTTKHDNRQNNDLWVLPAEGGDWQPVTMEGDFPSPRIQQVLMYDPEMDALIAFGGVGSYDGAYFIARLERS